MQTPEGDACFLQSNYRVITHKSQLCFTFHKSTTVHWASPKKFILGKLKYFGHTVDSGTLSNQCSFDYFCESCCLQFRKLKITGFHMFLPPHSDAFINSLYAKQLKTKIKQRKCLYFDSQWKKYMLYNCVLVSYCRYLSPKETFITVLKSTSLEER